MASCAHNDGGDDDDDDACCCAMRITIWAQAAAFSLRLAYTRDWRRHVLALYITAKDIFIGPHLSGLQTTSE